MKLFQRVLTMFLAICLAVGMIPATASAAENPEVNADSGDVTFESTNSFGHLLSQDLQEEQAQDEEQSAGGYTVLGLTIEGNTAMVEYSSLEEAVLVVALYTEDGLQMLCSGKTTVDPEATEAVVTIEGEVPEYFMAAAYLVDTYDYSPLCEAYNTPMYTKEMQDLLASTVDDYDEELVLNFDEDEATNFAVFAEGVKIIDYAESVNTVISADDENATYVIGNADSNITELQPGDIFAYTYGEEQILIVKVASIKMDGTTATIIGEDAEMEEIFSHVKMEQAGDAGNIEVDESSGPDNVVYQGKTFGDPSTDEPSTYAMRAAEGDFGGKHYLNFEFLNTDDDEDDDEGGSTTASLGLTGTIGVSLEIEFSYYISLKRRFVEFTADVGLKAELTFEGAIKSEVPLPKWKFTAYGLGIKFEPEFQFEVKAKMEISFFAGWTFGFSYENKKGFHDLTSKPKVDAEFKVEGSIFIGIDLSPQIDLVGGVIAEGKLEVPVGFELTAELKGRKFEEEDPDAKTIHDCEACVEMELKFKGEVSVKLKFLKMKKLQFDSKPVEFSLKITDMYWSIDRGEFRFTKCPHQCYRVAVHVAEMTDNNQSEHAANIAVEARLKDEENSIALGTTNKNGVAVSYLQPGTYTFSATVNGEKLEKNIEIKEACQISLNETTVKATNAYINGAINPDSITDNGVVIAKGNCGAAGDNVTWKVYSNGLLKIEGTGEMKDYIGSDPDKAPWNTFRSTIFKINITDGVTRIGNDAFYGCSSLSSINIPKGITSIGDSAFYGCSSLCSINIPKGITSIGDMVFAHCSSLSSINIPEGVTSIGEFAFIECTSLTSITLPESVTYIDFGAFFLCSSLSSINIPEGVTSIGEFAFIKCTSLTSITLPESVTNIGEAAFGNCTSLSSITIPKGIASIERETFFGCASLTSITIPESVTSIGDSAFENCSNLADIYYGGNEEQWDNISIGSSNNELINADIHFLKSTPSVASVVLAAPDEEINEITTEKQEIHIEQEAPTLDAVFGGEYSTEGTLKTASFSGLVPGQQYVLLVMASIEAEDVLDAENLLYIAQKAAEEDGTLVFTYVQRINTDTSYVVACGASNKNLQDATIAFPEMIADGEVHAVNPTVTYDTEVLIEGVDYVIVGKTDFVEVGTYTCKIRGIRNYTGLVNCEYTVADILLGDVNGDGQVNGEDRLALTRYLAKWTDYPASVINMDAADVNRDGKVNAQDRLILTRHLAAWNGYETLGA